MNSMSMTKKILMTMLMTAGFYLASWAQMTMTIGSKQVCAVGDSITIPVDVTAFDNVGTFSIKIVYDPAVLGFGRTLNWYSGFVGPDLVQGSNTPGQLLESFVMSSAAVSAGSGKLFDIKFKYLGGNTDVSFSVIPGDNEVTNALGNPYTVTYSNGAASQYTLPVAMITGDTEICTGESTDLMASGGVSYLWGGGETIGLINVSPTATTSYSVTVTDANGCTDDETVSVTVNALPTATFVVSDNEICFGETITGTMEASAPGPWTFVGGENGVYQTTPLMVSPTTWNMQPDVTTTFTLVSITDANGCTATINQDRLVTVNQLPAVTANTTAPEICAGDEVTLTGGGAVSYVWDNSVTDGVAFAPSTSLTYHVTGTDASGCTNTANVQITVNSLPSVTANSTFTEICSGQEITLTGGGAISYVWDNSVTDNVAFTPTATTTYTVTGTDANNCSNTASIEVVVNNLPPVTANSTFNAICAGQVITLTGGGALYYVWDNGVIDNFAFVPTATTTYTVTGTDAHNCSNIATVEVTVNPVPQPQIAGELSYCQGANTTLSTETYAAYTWSNNETTQSITVTSGTYSVTVIDANNCSGSDTKIVVELANPVINTSVTDVTCNGGNNGSITAVSLYTNIVYGSYIIDFSTEYGGYWSADQVLGAPDVYPTYGDNYGAWAAEVEQNPREHLVVGFPKTKATKVQVYETYSTGLIDTVYVREQQTGTWTMIYSGTASLGTPEAKITEYPVPTNLDKIDAVRIAINSGIINDWIEYDAITLVDEFSYSETQSNLTAATYTVSVTDNNGCTTSNNIAVNEPTPINAQVSIDPIHCFGETASITVTANGGTPDYEYSIDGTNYQTPNIFAGLADGTYSVTVKDANGCEKIVNNISITEPALLELSTGVDHVTCNGGNDGTIITTVDGGTGVAQYSLDGITYQPSNEFTGLTAGTYTVYAKDENNCVKSKQAIVFEPLPIEITAATTNATCNQNDGTATLTITGGNGTVYTQNWGAYNPEALAAGTYIVTVSDIAGCTATKTVVINNNDAPVVTVTTEDATCFNTPNGSASAIITGGTYPYTRNWGVSDTTAILAGNYSLTVTDYTGCVTITPYTINQPDQIVITPVLTHVVCNGESNGTATLAITGGIGAYTQNWGTANPAQLAAGSYTVSVSDEENCTVSTTIEITQPDVLGVTLSAQPISCNGGVTTVVSNVTGGTVNYSYSWYGGETTPDLTNVPAGSYLVTVTDAHNCTAYTSITFGQPDALVVTAEETTPIACNGGAAVVNVTATGGTVGTGYTGIGTFNVIAGNYTYTVTDANGCQASDDILISQPQALAASSVITTPIACNDGQAVVEVSATGGYVGTTGYTGTGTFTVSAGTYTYTVTDANNCTAITEITVSEPAALTVTLDAGTILCNAGTTNINSTVNGGTGTYTYSWAGEETTPNLTDVPYGTYMLTVTDANSCTANTSITVAQPDLLTVELSAGTILCNGNTTNVTSNVNGGTGTYSYSWFGGEETADLTAVPAGTYMLTVTDANNCTAFTSITLSQPALLEASSVVTSAVLCNGGNATVTVSATGGNAGTTGYTGIGDFTVIAGTHNYTVTDANGCTASTEILVSQPDALVASSVITTPVACNGGNAVVSVSAMGGYIGTTGYTGVGSFTVTAGNYSYTVTDANNCEATTSILVNQPDALSASAELTTPIACNGGNAVVTVSATGGTLAYTGVGEVTASAGAQSFIVTDANGCESTASLTILQPAILEASSEVTTTVACNGGQAVVTVSATGGTVGTGYTGIGTFNVIAGEYTYTVSDANGCEATTSIQVTEPASIGIVAAITNVTTYQGTDGAIDLTVTGGTGTYSFEWSNNAMVQNISGLTAGTYTVTVTDGNDCEAVNTSLVTQPSNSACDMAITASVTQNVLCFGAHNGIASVEVTTDTDPVTPYAYTWENSNNTIISTSTTANNLAPGVYEVIVTNADLSCTATSFVTITEPTAIVGSLTAEHVSCFEGNDGAITTAYSGGTGNLSYAWSNNAVTQNIADLTAGWYKLTVTDGNLCTLIDSIEVTQPQLLTVTLDPTMVTCNGLSNGSIIATVEGGTSEYTYAWSVTGYMPVITGLAAGTYGLTVEDAKGCFANASVEITQPAVLVAASAVTSAIACNGGEAVVSVSAAGGTLEYTGVGSFTVDAGEYTYTVTDANGCVATTDITVLEPAILEASAVITTPVSCNGGQAVVTVSATGGTIEYTGVGTFNVAAGEHTFTVTDFNNCEASVSITVTEPAALVASSEVTSAVLCNGGNATVTVSATGGNAGTTGYTGIGTFTVTAGTHNYTVTDANGCTATTEVLVSQPDALVASSEVTTAIACNGGNATVTVTATGGYIGTTGYDGVGTFTVAAGDYSYTVTDANNCEATTTITVTQPIALTASAELTTPIACNGGNAVVTVSATGGTLAYTGVGEVTASAGAQSFIVTDANGCESTASLTILQPAILEASSEVTTAVACNGGQAVVTVSANGGTEGSGYTGVGTFNVIAGDYTYTVSDANGCETTTSIQVTEPSSIGIVAAITNVTTYQGTDGAIDVTVTGGTGTYSFEWSNTAATQNISGLVAGLYTVTVTDENDCEAVNTSLVTQPSNPSCDMAITVTVTQQVLCNGANNGIVGVEVTTDSSPVTPYAYYWENADNTIISNTTVAENLAPGVYEVIVTNNDLSCTATSFVTITEPTAITGMLTATHVNCFEGNDGAISAAYSGGTGDLSYAWSNNAVVADITDLTAGWYKLTVTDENNCTLVDSIEVTQPELLTVTLDPTMVTCNGLDNGSITAVVNGGTMTYTYAWSNTETTPMISGLEPAEYSVVVTDANECTANASITITEPEVLAVTLNADAILCNGGTTNVTTNVTGGTTPYAYMWTGTEITESLTGVIAGTYAVTVTDANNCFVEKDITISEPAVLAATSAIVTPVACNGGDAVVSVSATGGVELITGGYIGTGSNTLAAGDYTFTVTDANGCSVTTSISVTEPVLLTAAADLTTPILCNGGKATVTVTATGGTGTYTGTGVFADLSADTYTYTVTDQNACEATATITVTEPEVLVVDVTATSILCNGGNATVTVTATGGTPVYSGTGEFTVLAGTYDYTVTDVNGCTATSEEIVIGQPDAITLSSTVTDALCYGAASGQIVATISGGTGTLGVVWSNNETTTTISNLVAGTYTVTVTDQNACEYVESISVGEAAIIVITGVITDVTTAGGNDGSIDITVTGGNNDYDYAWSNNAITEDIADLTAGVYSVTVTDGNGCTGTNSGIVMQPNDPSCTLTVSESTVQNVLCNGAANGIATVAITNEYNGPYTYFWQDANGNFVTDNDTAYMLAPGQYSVVVMNNDLSCMVVSGNVSISEPDAIIASLVPANVTCNGLSNGEIVATIAGGTGSIDFLWSNQETSSTISNLAAGTYTLTLTDENECQLVTSVDVTEPEVLAVVLDAHNVTCNGNADGYIIANVTGGTMPYEYVWSDNSTGMSLINIASDAYSVLVKDANDCEATAYVTITEPAVLAVTINQSSAIECNGGTTDLTTTVSGGTEPYTYNWLNGETTESINGVTAGSYYLGVADANGCVANANITVTEPDAISITASVINVDCNGNNNGEIATTVTGGTGSFVYAWSNNETSATVSNLAPGTYSVSVEDGNGCSATETYTITENAALVITGVINDVTTFGGNDGSIDITVTGGDMNYTYAWSNNATTEDITGLTAGVYSVTVTDGNACSVINSGLVTQPSAANCDLAIAASATNVTCNGLNNGAGDVQITADSNPVTPYTYFWTDASDNFIGATANITNLAPGTYNVVVMNADMSCTVNGTINVTEPAILVANASALLTDVLCNGDETTVTITATGGTLAYTGTGDYTVGAGTHDYTVTDANSCTASVSITITEPAALVASATATAILCNGGDAVVTVTATGGTLAYTGTGDFTVQAGTFDYTVTDANSCTATTSITVAEPSALELNATSTPASSATAADGAIDLTVTGGTGSYSYEWSNTAVTEDLTGLVTDTYIVTVTDANGCEETLSVFVDFVDAISSTLADELGVSFYPNPTSSVLNISCNHDASVVITDVTGKVVYNNEMNSSILSVDVRSFADGTYFLKVVSGDKVITSKVVVRK